MVLELPAQPESVSKARHEVGRFVEGIGARTGDIETAVTEAVANAVEHGFRGLEPGIIELRIELLVPDTLAVSVTDNGTGMAPDPGAAGLGFGLALIGRLSNWLEISPVLAGHGTRVRMRFRLDDSSKPEDRGRAFNQVLGQSAAP
jgi:anti-sigma regulatory factor (Ser/Thr protein kinase)